VTRLSLAENGLIPSRLFISFVHYSWAPRMNGLIRFPGFCVFALKPWLCTVRFSCIALVDGKIVSVVHWTSRISFWSTRMCGAGNVGNVFRPYPQPCCLIKVMQKCAELISFLVVNVIDRVSLGLSEVSLVAFLQPFVIRKQYSELVCDVEVYQSSTIN
jgi:hypothetical protein